MTNTSRLLASVGVLTLAALGADPAFASGTTAGSTITNTVTVDYQVGGLSQTQKSASDTLTVDRKINLTVAEVGSATTTVSPNQTAAVTTFSVTNTSNAVLDFALTVAQQTGGAGAHSNTDNFDVTNIHIYRDNLTSGTVGSFDAADTEVSYLDELAADASATVFVVADIPNGLANASVAAVTLTATGREGGATSAMGAALVQTGTATAGMDTVFADGAGTTDAARDAAFSANDDYTTFSAALTVTKSSKIISDPINGTTNPKFIPGAVVEYCIAVANGASAATATSINVNDAVPSELTYQSSYGIFVNGTVDASNVCQADGTAGGSYTAPNVSGSLANIAASTTKTLRFRATIN